MKLGSRIVKRNQSCEECGSSDARQVYDDEHSFCYSCRHRTPGIYDGKQGEVQEEQLDLEKSFDDILKLNFRGWKQRKLPRDVFEFYGIRSEVDKDGNPIKSFTPNYDKNKNLLGFRVRDLRQKDFYVVGKTTGLFGHDVFPGGGKRVIVTEGVEDMLALQNMNLKHYGRTYPVVSVVNAVTARKTALEFREYLRSFDEVILWMDNDTPGLEAREAVAAVVGFDKAKIVEVQEKDASDFIEAHGHKEALSRIFNATRIDPAGIVRAVDQWDTYSSAKELSYVPWPDCFGNLNEITNGRTLGSITLLGAGTGAGKTSFVREDIYHLLTTTEEKVGVCALEESVPETLRGILSVHLSKRLGQPGVDVPLEEEKKAFHELFKDDRLMLLDHQGAVDDGNIIDKMEFMALSGCKFIVLDHLTLACAGVKGKSANEATDDLMSDLLKLVKKYNIWVGVVSHLRKVSVGETSFEQGGLPSEDDFKNSGSAKQIAFTTIMLVRNKQAEDESVRNKTSIWVLKNRASGATGPAGAYKYNTSTGRLEKASSEKADDEEFELI